MQNMDKIFQESDDLGLIVSYYQKKGEPEKAAPHVKRVLDQRAEQGEWDKLAEGLGEYRSYLAEKEQRRYVNAFVSKTSDSHQHKKGKEIVLKEFSGLVNDKDFSAFFCNAIRYASFHLYGEYLKIGEVYGLVEKHKDKLDKDELKSKLADTLAHYIKQGKANKKDIAGFEQYLDEETKTFMVIKAIDMVYPASWERLREKDKDDTSREPSQVFSEFKGYISRLFAYDVLKEMVQKELRSSMFRQHISMASERGTIELLRRSFLTGKQVSNLGRWIARAQFEYSKPEYHQEDPAGDIHESADPDYGLPFAFDTFVQFRDEIDALLAKRIITRYLTKQFQEELVLGETYRKTKGTVENTLEDCGDLIDRETIENILADVFRENMGSFDGPKLLKKFKKYVNRNHVTAIIQEKLPGCASAVLLKDYEEYLSDEQYKDAVRSIAKRSLDDAYFWRLGQLIKFTESKFTPEELSELFLELFEEVKVNPEAGGRNRKQQDAVLEFIARFSDYIPRNESTEAYYELLDLKRSLGD
jgi:hypothetical protein